MKQIYLIIGIVLVLVLGFVGYTKFNNSSLTAGNVEITGTCNGTTTVPQIGRQVLLVNGTGNVCSVIITGSAAQTLTLYDATTTDINKRTGQKATSTITLASFGASPTVGNYPLNLNFFTGLLMETTGAYATATVTFRP